MAVQYPAVNGAYPDWSSIEISLGEQKLRGFKSINYKGGAPKGNYVYGTGSPDPIGITTGTNEYSGDIELFLPEFQQLTTTFGEGWAMGRYDISVSYSMPDGTTTTDSLLSCRLVEPDASQSQGGDPISRKLGLMPMKILYNGVDPLPPELQVKPL